MKVGYRSHTHIAVSHAKYSYNECCILEIQTTTVLSAILERWGLIISLPWLNTLSTGALDVLVLVLGAQGGKYEYKYKYSLFKYKYEYKYSGFVLEYNSITSTSTKYYISG